MRDYQKRNEREHLELLKQLGERDAALLEGKSYGKSYTELAT